MDTTDLPEKEVGSVVDMPAGTKCAGQSEMKSVEVTSLIVKRLRQRSGKMLIFMNLGALIITKSFARAFIKLL